MTASHKYTVKDLITTGKAVLDSNRPEAEYHEFLRFFESATFYSPLKIGSSFLSFSNPTLCCIYLYDCEADLLREIPPPDMPEPIGHLLLMLSRGLNPAVIVEFFADGNSHKGCEGSHLIRF